jgi:hypothetical protein
MKAVLREIIWLYQMDRSGSQLRLITGFSDRDKTSGSTIVGNVFIKKGSCA